MLLGIVTFIVGAVASWLVFWLRSKSIKVAWYEWLIGAIGLLLILGAIQHYIAASTDEVAPTAAWMGALVLVIPAFVLLAVAWQLAWRRKRSTS